MKMITISLRDDELELIEKLEKALGIARHQVVKLAIRRFLFPKVVDKIPLDGAYARVVDGFRRGDLEGIAAHDKAVMSWPKDLKEHIRDPIEISEPCPICDSIPAYPDDEIGLFLQSEEKLKAQGLKKFRCSTCGKRHVVPLENIIITESPMDRETRLKKAADLKALEKKKADAKAEADRLLNIFFKKSEA